MKITLYFPFTCNIIEKRQFNINKDNNYDDIRSTGNSCCFSA